ncbi:hypothetical protein [Desulfosarcina ovata]|nr:hypothetical protein [Desulfosarcina ovata]
MSRYRQHGVAESLSPVVPVWPLAVRLPARSSGCLWPSSGGRRSDR